MILKMILADPIDTIAAISTAPGTGAIAIVRMSGPHAWEIANKLFQTKSLLKSHIVSHGYLIDNRTNLLVDQVVLVPFRSPNSYTGEDLIEVNCHGGAVVTNEILALCLASGARLARPGEFTQRAFLNGKMDLTQAEAVLDVIQAKTRLQSKFAVSAIKGVLGTQIESIRSSLVE